MGSINDIMSAEMNRVTDLFGIEYPIIQAGMVWVSGYKLAAAVSNAGGLGLIGAGSMHPETLKEHIQKCKKATDKPFGVNIPLFYPEMDKILDIIIQEKVQIVFTSAGNPKLYTKFLKAFSSAGELALPHHGHPPHPRHYRPADNPPVLPPTNPRWKSDRYTSERFHRHRSARYLGLRAPIRSPRSSLARNPHRP